MKKIHPLGIIMLIIVCSVVPTIAEDKEPRIFSNEDLKNYRTGSDVINEYSLNDSAANRALLECYDIDRMTVSELQSFLKKINAVKIYYASQKDDYGLNSVKKCKQKIELELEEKKLTTNYSMIYIGDFKCSVGEKYLGDSLLGAVDKNYPTASFFSDGSIVFVDKGIRYSILTQKVNYIGDAYYKIISISGKILKK